ncbi:MAG: right-handed parallel beta-helix repeat-containing protein, partial [Candidatus Thorarchaeota archaeon]
MKSRQKNKTNLIIGILICFLIIGINGTRYINTNSYFKDAKSFSEKNTKESFTSNELSKNYENKNQKIMQSSYEEHNRIVINGNSNFNTTAYNEGWPGNGSFINPYIINGLNITGQMSGSYSQIEIHNTNVYFQITNCLLKDGYLYGIYLEYVTNGLIANNTITTNGAYSIYLDHSWNNTFSGNLISDNKNGFFLADINSVPNTTIVNNTFINEGIVLPGSNQIS